MTKIINRINHYFLADEEEHIPASDIAFFYGMNLSLPMLAIMILLIA